ncbi:MAG: glycosyltransferase family 2 protein [Synergistaceae bacterium]|nr:glycosyltransferase family 2 protein [Synergistaceae bacterium]
MNAYTAPDQTRPDHSCALISVIVPVYNVEAYLSRCLDSILAQTYTNLEIILIDDGSTDNSGRICDEYAGKDSRIRVIHQENQGLAEVRNIGVREAKGEYIQFVDSDDWIDAETIETCHRMSKEYGADIVRFGGVREFEDGHQKHNLGREHEPLVMPVREALSLYFFDDYVGTSSCTKLFKAGLFEGVTFPKGRVSEDTYALCKVIARAEKFLVISNEFYHYFTRNGSLSRSPFSAHSYDVQYVSLHAYEFITSACKLTPYEHMNLLVGLCVHLLHVANKMARAGKVDKEYTSELRGMIKPLGVLRCRHINTTKKAQLVIFKLSPKLYAFIYKHLKPVSE